MKTVNEMGAALRPVKRRIRQNRLLCGALWGLAAGSCAALILRIVALFVPVADKWLWAVWPPAAFALLLAAGNAARPVTDRTAAEAADRCGLQERAATALEMAGREEQICVLQREDACRALKELDTRLIRPGSIKRQALAALTCGILLITLLVIPNPRDREAEARQALTKTLKQGSEEIARAADEDSEQLTTQQRNELRRLTAELNRELLSSRDETDALVALDRAEQRLEQMENRTAGDAMAAADGNASNPASEGGSEGRETAEGSGTAFEQTASQGSVDNGGNRAGKLATRQALDALKAAVNPASKQLSQTAAATQTGTGQGEGRNGQQGMPAAGNNSGNRTGGGAGTGSTNLEQKGGGERQGGSAKGSRDPVYKEAEYESIYDPERTETTTRDEMTNQQRLGNEESMQAEAGPGKGNLGGNVPWNEVLREYEETETRSAERENLTTQERQWVNDYYSLLTEQQ